MVGGSWYWGPDTSWHTAGVSLCPNLLKDKFYMFLHPNRANPFIKQYTGTNTYASALCGLRSLAWDLKVSQEAPATTDWEKRKSQIPFVGHHLSLHGVQEYLWGCHSLQVSLFAVAVMWTAVCPHQKKHSSSCLVQSSKWQHDPELCISIWKTTSLWSMTQNTNKLTLSLGLGGFLIDRGRNFQFSNNFYFHPITDLLLLFIAL